MKDFYKHTRDTIDLYNQIAEKIHTGQEATSDEEDEFFQNFFIYLAHALIKDTGFDLRDREELGKAADIINDVIR